MLDILLLTWKCLIDRKAEKEVLHHATLDEFQNGLYLYIHHYINSNIIDSIIRYSSIINASGPGLPCGETFPISGTLSPTRWKSFQIATGCWKTSCEQWNKCSKNGLLYSVLDIEFGLWYASLKNRTQHDVTGVSVKTSRPPLVISDVRGQKLVIDYGHRVYVDMIFSWWANSWYLEDNQ